MKLKISSIVFMLLTSIMITQSSFSYAQTDNATATTAELQMSDQTSTNSTADNTDAQQISDFIHQSVADFKKQGDETRQVIFDCRDRIQTASTADADKIRMDCTTQLSAIKAKYQDERSHFYDLIKQYRQSVIIFLNDARGTVQMSKTDLDAAVVQLGMMMHSNVMGHGVAGFTATKNNTHCVNPPGGPAIC